MNVDQFLKSLSEVSKSPSAFIAYIILAGLYTFGVVYLKRQDVISERLKLVPEKDRTKLLQKEYNIFPKDGLSSEDWLKSQRYKYIFIGFIATFILIIILAGLAYSKPASTEIGVTVFPRGEGKLANSLFAQRILVVLRDDHGDNLSQMDSKGQAIFKKVKVGESAKLLIQSAEPYKAKYPDSNYIIPPDGNITLDVILEGSDHIMGSVSFKTSPLSDVVVTADTVVTSTDSNGHFRLDIPVDLRREEYELWFSKKGFETIHRKCHPQYDQNLVVNLDKSKRNN